MSTSTHLGTMRTEILARIAAGKLASDVVFYQALFDQITLNAGTCAQDLIDQNLKTSAALAAKATADNAAAAASTTLYLKSLTRNTKIAEAQTLQDSIDALPGAPPAPLRAERDAITAVRAYYGV